MKIKKLKELIANMNDETDVRIPSSLDGDYTCDAKAEVCKYNNGDEYLLIHE